MSPKSDSEFLDILRSWDGTPFSRFIAEKGVGVDCIRFGHKVYKEASWVGEIDWPKYDIRGSGPRNLVLLCDGIESAADFTAIFSNENFEEVSFQDVLGIGLKLGDLVILSSGNHFHHAAVAEDDQHVWHSLIKYGVVQSSLEDPKWSSRIYRVYRLTERL